MVCQQESLAEIQKYLKLKNTHSIDRVYFSFFKIYLIMRSYSELYRNIIVLNIFDLITAFDTIDHAVVYNEWL